jgi:hypothetical protein
VSPDQPPRFAAGARSELAALDEQDVPDAGPRELKRGRDANDTAADDDYFGGARQRFW